MKVIKKIDIIDGKPIILDNPIETEFELIPVKSLPTLPIYDSYVDYLTPDERKCVRLTSSGITVDTGKYLCSFYQGNRSHAEVAKIIKDILSR